MEVSEVIAFVLVLVFYVVYCIGYYAMIALRNAVMIASYIMQGIGFSTMAKQRGIERPWLAWVPVADTWLMGKISDQYREKVTGEDPNLRKNLLIQRILMQAVELSFLGAALLWYFGMVVAIVLGTMADMEVEPMLNAMMPVFLIVMLVLLLVYCVIAVIYCISQYKALFDIYRSSDPKTSTVFFVLSFFSQIALTLGIFLNRYKTLGIPPEPEEISEE